MIDYMYRKAATKILSNIVTWKNKILILLKLNWSIFYIRHNWRNIQNYVKIVIVDKSKTCKTMKNEKNSVKLFQLFSRIYTHYDVKIVFSWNAKTLMFDELLKSNKKITNFFYWIKNVYLFILYLINFYTGINTVFFCNLTMKM